MKQYRIVLMGLRRVVKEGLCVGHKGCSRTALSSMTINAQNHESSSGGQRSFLGIVA